MAGFDRARVSAAAALTALVLLTGAGCGSGAPPRGGTAPASPSQPAAASSAPSATAGPASSAPSASTAACDRSAWRQAPLTGQTSGATTGVSVVTGIRTAQHPECRYDRVVIDLSGGSVRYSVRYEAHVVADPSGKLITLPGTAYLVITVRPAQAHRDDGSITVPRQVHVTGYPRLRSWVISGDFEGVVSVALGLSGHAAVRVGALPGRLYVDVAE